MKMLIKCRVHSRARDRRNVRSPTTSFAFKYCPANIWLVSLDSSSTILLRNDDVISSTSISWWTKAWDSFKIHSYISVRLVWDLHSIIDTQEQIMRNHGNYFIIFIEMILTSGLSLARMTFPPNTWQEIQGSNGGFILATCNFVSHRSRHKPGPSLRRRGGILRGFRNIFWSRPGYAWTLKVAPSCLRNIKAIHIYRELDTVST